MPFCDVTSPPPNRAGFPYKASAVVMAPALSDEGDSSFGKYGKNAYV